MAAFPTGTRLYVIDTSSIIEPRRLLSQEKATVRDRLYDALGELVDDGDDDQADRPWEWARDHKVNAMGDDVTLSHLFESVRAVQEVVDNLVDFDKPSPGDDADPYVVGLALHLKRLAMTRSSSTLDLATPVKMGKLASSSSTSGHDEGCCGRGLMHPAPDVSVLLR